MSKKTFSLLIVFLLLIISGLGWYFFLREGSPSTKGGTETPDTNLFPFGQGSSGQNRATSTTGGLPGNENVGEINQLTGLPRLRQLSSVPTAGVVAFDVGSTTLIRYIEKATGHIYETPSDNASVKKISNVTIPKVYETVWNSDGSRLIIRYLKGEEDAIKTFSAKISTTTGPEEAVEGTFLQDNIRDITLLGNKIYYTNESSNGANGMTANLDGSGKVSVFSNPFTDWISKWTSPTGITISSRPSGASLGAAYLLNPSTGAYSKIAGELFGLLALANTDGSLAIISSTNTDNKLKTSVVDLKKSTVDPLGISTLVDKCVWSKKEKTVVYCAVPLLPPVSLYPDDWYRGKISFSDSIWRVDVLTGETKELVNPLFESENSMDIIDLSLDSNESVLVFRNKKDQFAWRYELNR